MQFITFTTVSIATDRATTRRRLASMAAGYESLTLAEMADFWRAVITRAEAEADANRAAFATRMLTKVQDSIGVTLGLRRPGR